MKHFILTAVLAASAITAHASVGTVATAGNTGGGQLAMTDAPCPYGRGMLFKAWTPRATSWGCWRGDETDATITVYYTDGDMRVYPLDIFTKTDYGMAKYPPK